MPTNDRKIIEILLEQVGEAEERYEGYRNELKELIADIVTAERQHKIQGINIQKQVNDKCSAAGRILADKRLPGESR